MADTACVDMLINYSYNNYYQREEADYTNVDCDSDYYKCTGDASEVVGCKTVTYNECDYYNDEICTFTTYMDDPVGTDKYWAAYGSYYNATYWEYYNG